MLVGLVGIILVTSQLHSLQYFLQLRFPRRAHYVLCTRYNQSWTLKQLLCNKESCAQLFYITLYTITYAQCKNAESQGIYIIISMLLHLARALMTLWYMYVNKNIKIEVAAKHFLIRGAKAKAYVCGERRTEKVFSRPRKIGYTFAERTRIL